LQQFDISTASAVMIVLVHLPVRIVLHSLDGIIQV
jgi:hypothetical protein